MVSFRARDSVGRVSFAVTAALGLGFVALGLGMPSTDGVIALVTGAAVSLIGLGGLLFWRTLRYDLTATDLVLRFGPLRARIPLADIRSIERRDLSPTLWASVRLPGLAFGTVRYVEVGKVTMFASSAATGILLIDAGGRRYGVTPQDEGAFVRALDSERSSHVNPTAPDGS